MLLAAAHPIVHVNAGLNTLATVLLVIGVMAIRQRKEHVHKNAMRGALVVSAAFLACYLYYHYQVGSVKFTHEGPARYVYYPLLASHVLLAMTVPFLALWAAWLGTQAIAQTPNSDAPAVDYRAKHRAVVRWAFPIWLYVSVTGVLVYLMLYWWFPPVEL